MGVAVTMSLTMQRKPLVKRDEPPRVSWRLRLLRGWSHDEANSAVFP
jgi:hypothetical protein